MSADQDGAAGHREAAVHATGVPPRPVPTGEAATHAVEVPAHGAGQLGDGREVPVHAEPGRTGYRSPRPPRSRSCAPPLAAGRDPDTLAELGWSLLHGVVMLTRGGRLRPEAQEQREEMIAARLLELPVAPAPRRGKVPGRSGGGAL